MTRLPQLQRDLVEAAHRLEAATSVRRGRRLRPLVGIVVALLIGAGVAVAADRVLNNGPGQFSDQYRFGTCPHHATALPKDALSQARRAAEQQAPAAYPGRDLRGVRATDAQVVTRRTARATDAGRCGLYGRTVLVQLYLPHAPFHSASMSQGAVYVSRIDQPGGEPYWELWGIEH